MKKKIDINPEIEKSNKLFGYDNLFNKFKILYKTNKLPKVILLTGDKGIGKSTFVFHFVNFILSINSKDPYFLDKFEINIKNEIYKRINLNIDQNYSYYNCEKPHPISVENVRNLKIKLSKSSFNALPRFTIIDDVELININSANSLLKLIEEPSTYDYYFLINNKKNKLIETIVSRSIEFKIFKSLKQKQEILNQIKSYFNIEDNFLHQYLNYSTPGNLVKFDNLIKSFKIDSMNKFNSTIYLLLENFKKSKNMNNLSLIMFLFDIKFSELINNKEDYLRIAEIKNKVFKLLNQYNNFSLNNNSVLNQFKIYLNHVR